MNYYVISDTHFGHDKMIEYCGRKTGFEETILDNIKNIVKEDDVLIHLGDVCIYRDEFWHGALMYSSIGTNWLIKGNHDRKSNSWYIKHGWDFVAEEMVMMMFGKRILLSHAPVIGRTDFDINIHGHLHNNVHHSYETTDKNKLVFMEHHYTPINLRKLVE